MFIPIELSPGELDRLLPGPPVVLLKAVGESAFVVVGGRRLSVPGVGMMLYTPGAAYDDVESGPPLDVLRAAAELHAERGG